MSGLGGSYISFLVFSVHIPPLEDSWLITFFNSNTYIWVYGIMPNRLGWPLVSFSKRKNCKALTGQPNLFQPLSRGPISLLIAYVEKNASDQFNLFKIVVVYFLFVGGLYLLMCVSLWPLNYNCYVLIKMQEHAYLYTHAHMNEEYSPPYLPYSTLYHPYFICSS